METKKRKGGAKSLVPERCILIIIGPNEDYDTDYIVVPEKVLQGDPYGNVWDYLFDLQNAMVDRDTELEGDHELADKKKASKIKSEMVELVKGKLLRNYARAPLGGIVRVGKEIVIDVISIPAGDTALWPLMYPDGSIGEDDIPAEWNQEGK